MRDYANKEKPKESLSRSKIDKNQLNAADRHSESSNKRNGTIYLLSKRNKNSCCTIYKGSRKERKTNMCNFLLRFRGIKP